VDARAVCGAAHLASAVLHARGAAAAGAARARDPKVEVMLYLSGQRQIKHAMARVGVGPRTAAFGIVLQGPAASTERAVGDLLAALSLRRDDKALSPSRAKLRRVLGEAPPAGVDDFEALALEATAMLRLE
jgi:tRNA threonylcarbamoyladenosine modification (KEOPS) complex Cgi121 subunit